MKERMIPLLLLTAIVAATILFMARQHADVTPMDRMSAKLQPISRLVPESSAISFQNQPIRNELHFYARYWLAPRYLPFHKTISDTLLTVCDADKADSLKTAYIAEHRRPVWTATEDGLVYLLTVKN